MCRSACMSMCMCICVSAFVSRKHTRMCKHARARTLA